MKNLLLSLLGVFVMSGQIKDLTIYWTGHATAQYPPSNAWVLPKGWSANWKDAQRFDHAPQGWEIPNGSHASYTEEPIEIDPKTGACVSLCQFRW